MHRRQHGHVDIAPTRRSDHLGRRAFRRRRHRVHVAPKRPGSEQRGICARRGQRLIRGHQREHERCPGQHFSSGSSRTQAIRGSHRAPVRPGVPDAGMLRPAACGRERRTGLAKAYQCQHLRHAVPVRPTGRNGKSKTRAADKLRLFLQRTGQPATARRSSINSACTAVGRHDVRVVTPMVRPCPGGASPSATSQPASSSTAT